MKALIVDGYNVIRRVEPYRSVADGDLDAARAALISDVAAFAAGEFRAVVVFDGGGNPRSDGVAESVAGVDVVFSPYGADADSVIEALAREARERGDTVFVVSSDAHVQWAVLGGSVVRVSSDEFGREVHDEAVEQAEHNPVGSSSVRLEDRIDPAVREKLARMARHGG